VNKTNRAFLLFSLIGMIVWFSLVWDRDWYIRISDHDLEIKGGNFTLLSSQGKVALTDFRDNVVIIYFGYTFCPDVCPTTLTMISRAFNQLTPDEKEQVQGLFITIDPERDTLDYLTDYLNYFSPKIIGLTGNSTEIAQVAQQYGISYRHSINSLPESSEYLVDHTAGTYLLNKQGRLIKIIPYETQATVLADEIRELLYEVD
jgi:protein SCO1/2